MRKQLLSIGLVCSAFFATSQTLLTENFDALTLGDLATQGGWHNIGSPGSATSDLSIVTVSGNNKALQLTGPSTAADYRNAYKALLARTAGNDVLYAEFTINTGAAATSSNVTYDFEFQDKKYKALFGFEYIKNSGIAQGYYFDSISPTTHTYAMKLGAIVSNAATDLILLDNQVYTVNMYYDIAKGQAYILVFDSNLAKVGSNAKLVHTNRLPNEIDIKSYGVVGNTAASSVTYDDILVKGRPCLSYDLKENDAFSYAAGVHCIGGSNLASNLVSQTVTGTYSSTPAGLSINSTTGAINLANSTANSYTVKFKVNNANTCQDSTTQAITVANCAGIEEVITSEFSVFPNPSNDVVTLTFSDLISTEGEIKFYSADGKLIESRNYSNHISETFDVKSLKAGIYFFQIGNTTEKVVIK